MIHPMKRIAALAIALTLISAPGLADSKDSLKNIEKQLEETLVLLEKWSQTNARKFEKSMNDALDHLEVRLKEARKTADDKTNRALDDVEKKIKELNKKLEELGKENPPNKEKARELQGEVTKVSKDFEAAAPRK